MRHLALTWTGEHGVALELICFGALLLLAVQLRVVNLDHYSGSFDEGVRAEQLLLMEHGYRPFRDIFASQGPLLLDLLYPFFSAFGGSLVAARLGVALLSLVGLLAAWWSIRALSPLAGIGAAWLLAVSPGYLEGSRLALAEIPSLVPCLLALGCALRWQHGAADRWLYLASVLGAVGVLIKPMAIPVAAAIALLALLRRERKVRVVAGAVLAAACLLALVLVLLDAQRVFEVLGAYRVGAQGPPGSLASENWRLISRTLVSTERVGFLALAAVGAAVGLSIWPRRTLALLVWPFATLVLFLTYTDLSDKHVVYLVPPLALLAGSALPGLLLLPRPHRGIGASPAGVVNGPSTGRGRSLVRTSIALASCAAVALYLVSLPSLWRADQELLRDGDERARRDYQGTREQAALMAALTAPGEYVLTDNPNAAFEARRLVPPWLVDTSGTRIEAGSLTSELAIREAIRYDVKVVTTWRRRLGKLEGFNQWLAIHYRFIKTYPGSDPSNPLRLYVRRELEGPARAILATISQR